MPSDITTCITGLGGAKLHSSERSLAPSRPIDTSRDVTGLAVNSEKVAELLERRCLLKQLIGGGPGCQTPADQMLMIYNADDADHQL